MKKILFSFILSMLAISCLNIGKTYVYAESSMLVKTIYSNVCLFADADINSEVVATSKYGEKLSLNKQEKVLGKDTYFYYEIVVGENICYVLCSQVLQVENKSPEKELDHNASLKEDCYIYEEVNQEFKPTDEMLYKNEKIKILDGYDSTKQYTRIQYKDQDGDIMTAYVKTTAIKTSSISKSTISAIIVIISVVSLVLVVFGIKGKNKNASKKNKKLPA